MIGLRAVLSMEAKVNEFLPIFGTVIVLGFGAYTFEERTMETVPADSSALISDTGMTLYVYDNDTPGTSNCLSVCAKNWPPYFAPETARGIDGYSIVIRPDGLAQSAYLGKPLYLSGKDSKPGDVNGNGFKNLWHAAKNAIGPRGA